MWAQLEFFPSNIYNLVFSDKKKKKKKLNSKHLVHVGFCDPKLPTKFRDFAADMAFET